MRILFYAGYQVAPFDSNTETGLAGTEIAIIKVAEELVKFGHHIIVSGQVKSSGVINGVEWISTEDLHQKYFNRLDVIVSASYIHFLKEFKNYNAKKIFWAHNTHHHSWWNGKVLSDADKLTTMVDHTVCLTKWHANQWANSYGIDKNKISIIGNGIDPVSFIGHPEKIKGRFIWTSAKSRGLSELINNWPKIKSVLPHATLDVYTPEYDMVVYDEFKLEGLEDIRFMGSVNQIALHDAMLRAEYWCYITDYKETYCITALEMQYARVLPIVTKVAALSETVNSGILLDRNETNWNQVVKILDTLGNELKDKSIDASFQWAKQQTWDARSYDWKSLLETI